METTKYVRECPYCGLFKPYDPSAKRNSKASGFHGCCYPCRLDYNAKRYAKRYATPTGKIAQCAANSAYAKANPEKMREHTRRRRKPVLWANTNKIAALERQRELAHGTNLNHIVPIHGVDPKDGRKVSGLHVEYNLEVIPAAKNKGATKQHVDLTLEAQRIMDRYHKNRFEASRWASKPQGAWINYAAPL